MSGRIRDDVIYDAEIVSVAVSDSIRHRACSGEMDLQSVRKPNGDVRRSARPGRSGRKLHVRPRAILRIKPTLRRSNGELASIGHRENFFSKRGQIALVIANEFGRAQIRQVEMPPHSSNGSARLLVDPTHGSVRLIDREAGLPDFAVVL